MFIEIDLQSVPPTTTLREPYDFTSFSVKVRDAADTFISEQTLRELAGETASDPDWQSGVQKMIAYASQRGWLNASGDVQAHVERIKP